MGNVTRCALPVLQKLDLQRNVTIQLKTPNDPKKIKKIFSLLFVTEGLFAGAKETKK